MQINLLIRHMACLVYVIKSKIIFDHFTLCLQILFTVVLLFCWNKGQKRWNIFYKTYLHLSFCPDCVIITLENKTLNASFFIITSIFSKPGFCVRPVNRFFNSKFIYLYFLLMLSPCVALLCKTIPCSNSCSNIYPLQQHLLTICENQLCYVVYWWSSVRLLLDKNHPLAISHSDMELAPSK